jgi:hypothetical protein
MAPRPFNVLLQLRPYVEEWERGERQLRDKTVHFARIGPVTRKSPISLSLQLSLSLTRRMLLMCLGSGG